MSYKSTYAAVFALILAFSLHTNALAAPGNSGNAQNSARIGLVNFPFDTSRGEPPVPSSLRGRPQKPGRPGYVIIAFNGRMNEEARARLKAGGVRFYSYVPDNGFLAKVPYGRRNFAASDPDVAGVYDYLPAYRLEGGLIGMVERGARGVTPLVVKVFDGEELTPVISAIEALGGAVEVLSDRPGLNGKAVRVRIDAAGIAGLASVDGVQWVEQERVPELHNDVSAPVVNADYAWSQPTPLTGTGQVVGIADSGLDNGDAATIHLDFRGNTSDGYPKIKQAFAYGRANDWSDPHGHGTHTTATLTGFGAQSDLLQPGTELKGTAYDARLVFQSIGVDAAGSLTVPNLNSVLFPDAYGAGARVHSNSWGLSGTAGSYTYSAVLADTYTWNNKDFTVLFSAGNDGVDKSPADGVVDLGSVASPSTAKNVITVGASENNRPNVTTKWGVAVPNTYQPPILNDKMADNTSGMAAFSGRGPCVDGRIKPDVVAPGTYTLSARSSASANYITPASNWGYPSSFDPYYGFKSGTSMSCPLTAGVAALVRQYLADKGIASPSSALVKGLLVAGAFDMTPGQYSGADQDVTARPDMNQGWGRVNVKASLYPAAPVRVLYDDYQTGLGTAGSRAYTFGVADTSVPVRVNVVWTDYPGSSGVSPNIVNDLDLVVSAPDGNIYHGNVYSGSASVANPGTYDRLNNVEGVTIPAGSLTTGAMTVTVYGYNIPNGPQPFALVASGGFDGPPSVSGVSPDSGVNNADTPVTVSGSGFISGAEVYVGGVSCAVGSVSANSISATVPAGIPAGVKDVVVLNPDTQSGTLAGGFTVILDTVPPAAPSVLAASPGDTAINLRWTPGDAPDLAGHRVYFNSYSTTVGTGGTHKLTGLTNGMSYDVYVRAVDAAGNLSGPTNTATATPYAPVSELPHYNWDASSQWDCVNCHISPSGGFIAAGFDYRYSESLCLSCHNAASVAHGRTVDASLSHPIYANVTSGVSRMPVFGSVTSGEYSDAMYSHLKDGTDVVCNTCHNVMRKPHDAGRAWEFTSTQDDIAYTAAKGGWWDQGHAGVRVYRDGSLWTPTYSRDREALRLDAAGYSADPDAGTLGFANATTGYVYLTLADAYLRAPGSDNTACADCHDLQTHMGVNCLACHTAHNTSNLSLVGGSVRNPDGVLTPVVFNSLSGANSFADGDASFDGICEVCHTATLYYRYDGSGFANHSGGVNYDGSDCRTCHNHATGFAR